MSDRDRRDDPPPGDPAWRDQEEEDLERAQNLLEDLGMPDHVARPLADPMTELDRLYEVACAINSTLDLDELLPRILTTAIEYAGAEKGILFRFDDRTGESLPIAVRGVQADEVPEATRYSRTVIDDVRRRQTVHLADAQADPRARDIPSLTLHEIRSLLCVPIIQDECVLGAIYLANRTEGKRLGARAVRFTSILAGLSGVAIRNAERYRELHTSRERLARQLGRYQAFDEIIGRSRPMMELLRNIERVALTDFPVLLQGEIGSGKELAARAIHRIGTRREGPFIAQNCAAIPSELLESEFFGVVRGAYTGANASREGLFRLADGGTLFLDEIAELDLRLQAKLLRVLEDGQVRPVGSQREYAVNFRLLSATGTDLRAAVASSRFRSDLYYRLNVVVLRIPPLRERGADIPVLIHHFIERYKDLAGGKNLRFSQDAVEILQRRPWRGNVRELEHFVKRALVLSDRLVVEPEDLDLFMEEDLVGDINVPIGDASLKEIEDFSIREALRRTNGNKTKAAELLGMHRNAFLRRLRRIEEGRSGEP